MGDGIKIITSDFIKINISNSKNNSVSFEKKFPKNITIADLKNKLEIITGGCASTMAIELFDGDRLVCKVDNNSALLGSYPIEDAMRLHVTDTFLFINENVEKFELTDQQYNQKQDSVKNYLKTNKLGKYNEEEMKKLEEKKKQALEDQNKKTALCTVGSRCRVTVKGKPTRLGTVMYNGELDGKAGTYIGVKYDEPLGVNDGSIDGKRYFDCQLKYGGFVSPLNVEVGDYPPEISELDEEI